MQIFRQKTHPYGFPTLSLITALAACLAVSVRADAPSLAGTTNLDPATVSQLLQRMDQLEQKAKRVDELEAELKVHPRPRGRARSGAHARSLAQD